MTLITPGERHDGVLDFLARRRSVPLSQFRGPGPDTDQLRALLTLAARVPDHGRLEPWRFIIVRSEAGRTIGEGLAGLAEKRRGHLSDEEAERERNRLARAPLAIIIVSAPKPHDTIPRWEQFLSAGAVASTLVTAATAAGFAANWVTGWYSDDADARALMGLSSDERVAGIVHLGHHDKPVPDRPRPDIDALVTEHDGTWDNTDDGTDSRDDDHVL